MTMKNVTACLAIALGAAVAGCNGEEDQASTPAPAAQPAASPQPAAPKTSGTAATPAGTERPPQQGAQPAPPPSGLPDQRDEAPPPAAPQEPPQAAASKPPPAAQQQPAQPTNKPNPAQAQTPQDKARALLEQLQSQKGQGQWDAGEKTLQELDKLKGSLPADVRDEIDSERASFRAAKQIWGQSR